MSFGGEGQARRGLLPGGTPLLDVLLLAVLARAAVLLWSFVGGSISGTSVAKDSINSGSKPRVRLANAAERVRVEG